MKFKDIIASVRVRQWTKNVIIFAAVIFAGRIFVPGCLARVTAAFFLFCLASGAVYILNDILDIERDREHPLKRNRPFAAGRLSIRTGWIMFVILSFSSGIAGFILDFYFGFVLLLYLFLQILYSNFLKNIVIIDVLMISVGFLLRVIAGAVVISAPISNWILVCTMLLALFLALSKRRHELTLLESNAGGHRAILKEYSPYLLDQMIMIVTSATLVAYTIFTLSPETEGKYGHNMILTVPFVLYGIFRYLYLVHQKNAGGQPEETLLSDLPLQINIGAYGIASVLIIYFS